MFFLGGRTAHGKDLSANELQRVPFLILISCSKNSASAISGDEIKVYPPEN